MPRATSFLRQAVSVLRTRAELEPPFVDADAWSSTYLPLAALLGDALSVTLRANGELKNDFLYVGPGHDAPNPRFINEHVVPMKCLVRHLIAAPALWAGPDGVTTLRAFLCEHLVLARIPKQLNDLLPPSEMPNDAWHLPCTEQHGELAKNELLWARYRGVEGLRMHWEQNPHFVRR